jgi:hypothetical protein
MLKFEQLLVYINIQQLANWKQWWLTHNIFGMFVFWVFLVFFKNQFGLISEKLCKDVTKNCIKDAY